MPLNKHSDYEIPQNWAEYTPAEHAVWHTLYTQQTQLLPDAAAPEVLHGIARLNLSSERIPRMDELSEQLLPLTGWRVIAVPGLIPEAEFFRLLAQRVFVAGRFIRRPEQLEYLQEPDIFHDVFGHVPLLTSPIFADYMQAFGEGGLRSIAFGTLENLARLYWYTVEFGLVKHAAGLRIYGAGILSSKKEVTYSLTDQSVRRRPFDLKTVLQTPYEIDHLQSQYFVVDSLDALLSVTTKTDFAPLYRDLTQTREQAH